MTYSSNLKNPGALQLISDVHLDMRMQFMEIKPSAPTLVVAGDVMSHTEPRYRETLQRLFRNHKYGVYVPGNHEIWGASGPISGVLDFIEQKCKSLDTSVTLLRAGNWGFDVPGTETRIVGATLWTHIPDKLAAEAPRMLNDFNYIKTATGRPITSHEINQMHEIDKKWIVTALRDARHDNKTAVVVTHHAPDIRLSAMNDAKATNGMGVFYYNVDMDDVLNNPGISAWMYGHTHESWVLKLRGLDYPFVTNALGYPSENTGYSDGAGVQVIC